MKLPMSTKIVVGKCMGCGRATVLAYCDACTTPFSRIETGSRNSSPYAARRKVHTVLPDGSVSNRGAARAISSRWEVAEDSL